MAQTVKNLPAMQETQVWSLGQEDTLEKGMATHSSILRWRIPWTEEPGELQSRGRTRLDTTEWLTQGNAVRDFSGGPLVEDPPADVGCPWKTPHYPDQLSLFATTTEPVLQSLRATITEAHVPRDCVLQQEKPPQWEARAAKNK